MNYGYDSNAYIPDDLQKNEIDDSDNSMGSNDNSDTPNYDLDNANDEEKNNDVQLILDLDTVNEIKMNHALIVNRKIYIFESDDDRSNEKVKKSLLDNEDYDDNEKYPGTRTKRIGISLIEKDGSTGEKR